MKGQEQQVTPDTALINDDDNGQIVSLGPLSCFISEVNRERMKTAVFVFGGSIAGGALPFISVAIGNAMLPLPSYVKVDELYELAGIIACLTTPAFGTLVGVSRCCSRQASQQASQQAPGLA